MANGDVSAFEVTQKYIEPGPRARRRKHPYKLQKVWDHHQEVIRRLALGQKPKQIASEMPGITAQIVTQIRSNPMVQRRLQFLHDMMNEESIDVGKRIRTAAGEAQMILEEIMHNKEVPSHVRAAIANSQLDRAIGAAPRNINVNTRKVVMTVDVIEGIKERARSELRRSEENASNIESNVEEAIFEEIKDEL